MAFQIFLTDNINTVQMDTDDIATKSIFSIQDVEDVSARKEDIKSIQLKGTKTNNEAFGSFFDWGRTSDLNNPNGLFFNYNPIQAVTCLVYEESLLVFKGDLRISQFTVDTNGEIIYDCVVTGAFINLKTSLQDLYLTDLDFSDLKHHYNIANIVSSWTGTTETYDVATSAFTTSYNTTNYVYPNIDYGELFVTAGKTINELNARNFKAAIYVNEYMNKIFSTENGLTGFTYEIKGSPDFIDMFNSLIIPDNQEGNKQIYTGWTTTYSSTTGTGLSGTITTSNYTLAGYDILLPVNNIVNPPANTLVNLFELYSSYDDVLYSTRTLNVGALIQADVNVYNDNQVFTIGAYADISLQLLSRNSIDNNNPYDTGWNVIAQQTISISPYTTYSGTMIFNSGLFDLTENQQLAVRFNVIAPFDAEEDSGHITYSIDNVILTMPPSALSTDILTADMIPTITGGDTLSPVPPVNVKQIDFIKSIVNQFNFYVYTNNDNYKHLIFEKYDDFYSLMQPEYLIANALDWTNKIDYSKGFVGRTNINLPTSYSFTYKQDNDRLTDYYYKKFNQTYGTYILDDSRGLIDIKKVELIFSPTIIFNENGTSRTYPALYTVDNNFNKFVRATNIRMCYYNGLQNCEGFTINNETSYASGTTFTTYYSGGTYPQVSNYYLFDGLVVSDLNFSVPYEYYFTLSSEYENVIGSYENYFQNQLLELINPNIIFIDCNVYLNEVDISNLDLTVPVYINTGINNGAYFKVLKVEYDGNDSISKATLQKISF